MKRIKQKLIIERAAGIFAWLSFFLAVILAVTTVLASASGEEKGKSIFGFKLLIVASDSMSGEGREDEAVFFESGDLLIVNASVSAEELQSGDVISFISYNPDSYGKTVSHKIREVKYSKDGELIGFVTYGIRTGVNDKVLVKPEDVIGRYSLKLPEVGKIFSFLKTPAGYFLSIIIPAVLLIIFFSIKVGRTLGQRELAREYNGFAEEMEALKERVAVLEGILNGKPAQDAEEVFETDTEPPVEEITEDKGLSIPRGRKTSFKDRILSLDLAVQNCFLCIHNELSSYKKVSSRLSFKCISYRVGRRLIAKITVRGRTLTLHLALPVDGYKRNVYFQRDLSEIKAYSEVPFAVKVKSERGRTNAIKLIGFLTEKLELSQNVGFVPVSLEDVLNPVPFDGAYKETENAESFSAEAEFPIIPKGKRASFSERLSSLDLDIREYFSRIDGELKSYKRVSSRLSFKCISYRIGRKLISKMTVRGRTLTLHLALPIDGYKRSVYFQRDLSEFKAYSEVPFAVKLKSERGAKNAIKLINILAEKNELSKYIKKT